MEQAPDVNWPEEVKKAYEHLKIPSLYDAVLENEKLAVEIRRQNKEIKSLNETIHQLNGQMKEVMDILLGAAEEGAQESEEDEESEPTLAEELESQDQLADYEMALFDERQERVLRETRNALLESVDAVMDLAKNSQKTLEALKAPSKGWFSKSNDASDIADSLLDQINAVQYRLLGQLDELNIKIIEPHPGDSFIPQKHRPLERIPGGKSGIIARIFRIGYIQDNVVLRCADVAIYS